MTPLGAAIGVLSGADPAVAAWRSAVLRGIASVAGLLALGAGALGLAVAAVQPDAWAVGVGVVLRLGAAWVGTAAAPAWVPAALVGAWLAGRGWSRDGRGQAWALLGRSGWDAARLAAPLAVAASIAAAGVGLRLEPAAWSAFVDPALLERAGQARVARILRGDLQPLPGGALLVHEGELRLRSGALTARVGAPTPDGDAWHLEALRVQEPRGSWQFGAIALRADSAAAPAPSVRAVPLVELRRRARSGQARALLVLHRRLAAVVGAAAAVLLGAAAGWRAGGPAVGVGALGWLLLARLGDRLASDGSLPGAISGWLPLLALVLSAALVAAAPAAPGRAR